jgi:hypothetical protein
VSRQNNITAAQQRNEIKAHMESAAQQRALFYGAGPPPAAFPSSYTPPYPYAQPFNQQYSPRGPSFRIPPSKLSALRNPPTPLPTLLLYVFLVLLAAAVAAYGIAKYALLPKQSRDCLLSEWSTWSGCDNGNCNGVATRARTITQQAAYGGHECFEADLVQAAPCADFNACDARDCQYGAPVVLASCSADACYDPTSGACRGGAGEEVVYTPITHEPLPGGRPCDWSRVVSLQPCDVTQTCSGDRGPPKDCSYSDWGPFAPCPDVGDVCALPGSAPWWTYAYRSVVTPAEGGGAPCGDYRDMVRSQTCPQLSCTWCSLSWDDTSWSQPTFPCGPATHFMQADVVYSGDLPCISQSVTSTSLGACAVGAFDAFENATCSGYDELVPCTGAPLGGAHLPPLLWTIAQQGTAPNKPYQNLLGGEFDNVEGASLLPLAPELGQGAIPPPSADTHYLSFCLMVCAEMTSCSGVLWDEGAHTGSMMINTASSEAATCSGVPSVGQAAAAPQEPEVYFISFASGVLATAVADAQSVLGSDSAAAAPARVAQRLVETAWGLRLATIQELEAQWLAAPTATDNSLLAGYVSEMENFYDGLVDAQQATLGDGDIGTDSADGVPVGAWVRGVKPSEASLLDNENVPSSYSVLHYCPASGFCHRQFDVRWALVEPPPVQATPEVFFLRPSAALLRAEYDAATSHPQLDAVLAMQSWVVRQGFDLVTQAELQGALDAGLAPVAASAPNAAQARGFAAPRDSEWSLVAVEVPDPSSDAEGATALVYPRLSAPVLALSNTSVTSTAFGDWGSEDWDSAAEVLSQSLGLWVRGFKPAASSEAFDVLPWKASDSTTSEQWSQWGHPTLGGSSGMTAHIWNPASTNCARVVWPMVGAACLEVCTAGTSDLVGIGRGVQSVLNRGAFTASVFPLNNGQLSCPITPQVMEASGMCAPDAAGEWTSQSCALSQDCVYQSWSDAGVWSMCDATCGQGGGSRKRVRKALQQSAFLGTPCTQDELVEFANCNEATATSATEMACVPPPGSSDKAPLAVSSAAACLAACTASTSPKCTAAAFNAKTFACQLFGEVGGIDNLLYLGACTPSADVTMLSPPCDTTLNCSLSSWTSLNTCDGCATEWQYQTRSIVAQAQDGGVPCDHYPTMQSVSCGAPQNCNDLPCVYGPWPTDQPTASSPTDVSACLKYLQSPAIFTSSWSPRTVGAFLGAGAPLDDLGSLNWTWASSADTEGVGWDIAHVLNTQCLNADGSAPLCIQTFPDVTDAALLQPSGLEDWGGWNTYVLAPLGDAPERAAWGPVLNGGAQAFLGQLSEAVDAAHMTPQTLVTSLTAAGFVLASPAQVQSSAARGATTDLAGAVALVGNADGTSGLTSATSAVGGGTVTFVAAPTSISGVFGVWLWGPKPLRGARHGLFAPLEFSASSSPPALGLWNDTDITASAPPACPDGIDATWQSCVLAALAAPASDARLLFSSSTWSCPSLCPAVPSFCSWSACDATCSSTIYPGQRSMLRSIVQYATDGSAFPCNPLAQLSQSDCSQGLPACTADCPLGSDGTPCNTANGYGSCDSGTCTCTGGRVGETCENTCSLGGNGQTCSGLSHGECLPSGACRCFNGWFGPLCDQQPVVALGNSALVMALLSADLAGARDVPSYAFGKFGASPGGCTDDGAGNAGRHACNICVPFSAASAANGSGVGGGSDGVAWVPGKYLNVLWSAPSDAGVTSFASACNTFWDQQLRSPQSQTLAAAFPDDAASLPSAAQALWVYVNTT